jgi:hypothetical protein
MEVKMMLQTAETSTFTAKLKYSRPMGSKAYAM